MKISSLFPSSAAVAFLAVSVYAATSLAQAPQTTPPLQPATGGAPHEDHDHQHHPVPTNLKVLPKTLTGEQVHEIMEGWEAALGTHCDNCHTADPKNIGPNGRPRLNFADDTKPAKSTARLMYKMTLDINENYISMVDNSGAPVTCGTCHRGHLGPEPFIAPKEQHDGPRSGQNPPPHDDKPEKPH
ncbi:MAG: c-type cytochrome [Terracidiphilus sp.]